MFRPGLFGAGCSGIVPKKVKTRKRPSKYNKKPKPVSQNLEKVNLDLNFGLGKRGKDNRKANDVGTSTGKLSELNPQEVILKGGCLMPNEHFELELSRIGTMSRLGNSSSQRNT